MQKYGTCVWGGGGGRNNMHPLSWRYKRKKSPIYLSEKRSRDLWGDLGFSKSRSYLTEIDPTKPQKTSETHFDERSVKPSSLTKIFHQNL